MAALACLPPVLFAQSGDPGVILRTETRAVEINVAVKDQAGAAIRDLRREDFTVLDEGKPREIGFFAADAEPTGSGAAARPATPSTRLTALVLDGLNTEFTDQSYAQEQALQAVERMKIDESVAVLALAPGLKLQDFTRDRSRLLAAIQAFHPNLPPYPMKQRVQVTLAALKTLAERMSRAPGRKSIVWVTGGFPQIHAYEGTIQKALEKIDGWNVAIYPVDARGLTVGSGAGNIQTMIEFADSTGGEAYYNRNDLGAAIEDAAADTRSTYVVGFYLGDKERDHRFHELKVRVDRPGAVVRCRRGYSPDALSALP